MSDASEQQALPEMDPQRLQFWPGDGPRRSGAVVPIVEPSPSPLREIAKRLVGQRVRELVRERRNLRYHYEELRERGWQKSILCNQAVDNDGPIPWITYPALSFIQRLVAKHHRVFEYGCGNSSLWWSSRAASVVSVEHNPEWARNIASRAPPQLQVVLRPMHDEPDPALLPLAEEFFARDPELPTSGHLDHDINNGLLCREFIAYAAEVGKYGRDHFDIIVVDGMARGLTAWMAVHFLKQNGFIIFDNSDRWQYNCAYKLLAEHGFKRIDFHGLAPGRAIESCTTVYMRTLDPVPLLGELKAGQGGDLGW